jgi:hypothetical protein
MLRRSHISSSSSITVHPLSEGRVDKHTQLVSQRHSNSASHQQQPPQCGIDAPPSAGTERGGGDSSSSSSGCHSMQMICVVVSASGGLMHTLALVAPPELDQLAPHARRQRRHLTHSLTPSPASCCAIRQPLAASWLIQRAADVQSCTDRATTSHDQAKPAESAAAAPRDELARHASCSRSHSRSSFLLSVSTRRSCREPLHCCTQEYDAGVLHGHHTRSWQPCTWHDRAMQIDSTGSVDARHLQLQPPPRYRRSDQRQQRSTS